MNSRSSVALLCLLSMSVWGCPADKKSSGFALHPTISRAPADPLAGSDVQSCPIYQETMCQDGQALRCEIYDSANKEFVDSPDPLLERVYLYDRWYDLYSSPAGLTAERVFTGPMPGDTPEEVWGDPENFLTWAGRGDAGIWTGAALVSDIFRYVSTGTEADYQRMEAKVRTLVRSFQVTGIPGHLARHHFLLVPEGTPPSDQLMLEIGDSNIDYHDHVIGAQDQSGLPEAYSQGVPDGAGGLVQGIPMWNGRPSIDQYTGPMTSFPLVYNLLRDEQLKERLVHHMTCYLKRLKRIEIINLQDNQDAVEEIAAYFGGSGLQLDPGDPDFLSLERLVWYIHPQINDSNRDVYPTTCPDSIEMLPSRVIDAASDSFMLDMLELSADMDVDGKKEPRPNKIDHFYIVNLRGGDASHLIHLAAMAYYFTGDEQYRSFLFDELIAGIDAEATAQTMMAFRLPDWCFRYYGDHITYGTHWQLLTMLPDSELRDDMARVMEEEAWQKALYNHKSAKFNVMYASILDDQEASARDQAIAEAVSQLQAFGGNDGVQNAPRRTHDVSRQEILDAMPAGIGTRCPSEEERSACEDPGTLFGIPLESDIITHECDGRAGECTMADGLCTEALAADGLPSSMRKYADFMWQRSPFQIGDPHSVDGQKQSPGRDLSEPYWMARHYGFIQEGTDHVLAWRPTGDCP